MLVRAAMRRGSYALIGLGAAAGMAAAAWVLVVPHFRRETVTIVSLLPRQGASKPRTDAIARGIGLALEEHDHRAGRFRVKHEDWDYSVAAGGFNSMGATSDRLLRTALDRPDVPALIGAYDSATTARILLQLRLLESSLLVISPASARMDLTEAADLQSGPSCFFRTIPTSPVEGVRAAAWAKASGARRIHVYNDDLDHRTGHLMAFTDGVRDLGLPVSVSAEALPETLAEVAVSDRPDLLYLSGNRPEVAAAVVKALKAAGFKGRILMGSGCADDEFLTLAGPDAEGVYVTDGIAPPPAEFTARHKTSDPYAYYGYLAAKAAIGSIARAGSKDRLAVLRECSRLPTFDGRGEFIRPAVALYQVRNGRFELVEVLR